MRTKLSVLAFILVNIQLTLSAQQVKPAAPKGQFIAIFVNNFDSTLKWYTDKIGFTILKQEAPAPGLKFAMLKWNDFMIEMIQNPKVATRQQVKDKFPEKIGAEGFFKLGFFVEDINYWEKIFKERKTQFKYELLTNENFRMKLFILEDPEGNLLQFYSNY